MFGEVALDGSDAAATSFTSHYTTHDGMQAILDFPFQWAARDFASKGGSAQSARPVLPSRRLVHRRRQQRPGAADLPRQPRHGPVRLLRRRRQPRADGDELLRRDLLGHELMYFSRGNPVVYYGDEQGFTGTGGDQLARQTMFASQVPEYQDDDQLGSERDAGDRQLRHRPPALPVARRARRPARGQPGAAPRRPAGPLRRSDGPGILAFSRIDRREQREYVVALNNAETGSRPPRADLGARPAPSTGCTARGPTQLASDGDRRLAVTVPALSTVVYESTGTHPRLDAGPRRSTSAPRADRRRAEPHPRRGAGRRVDSFYEVTFQAKVGGRSVARHRHRRLRAVPRLPRHRRPRHRHPRLLPRRGARQRRPRAAQRRTAPRGWRRRRRRHHLRHATARSAGSTR